jgi:hypothetical protein
VPSGAKVRRQLGALPLLEQTSDRQPPLSRFGWTGSSAQRLFRLQTSNLIRPDLGFSRFLGLNHWIETGENYSAELAGRRNRFFEGRLGKAERSPRIVLPKMDADLLACDGDA